MMLVVHCLPLPSLRVPRGVHDARGTWFATAFHSTWFATAFSQACKMLVVH